MLDGALASVALRAEGRPLLLFEYRAVDFALLKKSASAKTAIEPVLVNGEPGLWLEGGPHTLTYFNRRGEFRQRTVLIRGNVLLWTAGRHAAPGGQADESRGSPARAADPVRVSQIPSRGKSRPPRSPNTKCMTAAELQIDTETEMDRIERWRAEGVVRAGYEPSDALALAARHDIDLHFAVEPDQAGLPVRDRARDPDLATT